MKKFTNEELYYFINNNLEDAEKCELNNHFAREHSEYNTEEIFSMNDFNLIISEWCVEPEWIVTRTYYGDFRPFDFFWFVSNQSGNFVSMTEYDFNHRIMDYIESYIDCDYEEVVTILNDFGYNEEYIENALSEDDE